MMFMLLGYFIFVFFFFLVFTGNLFLYKVFMVLFFKVNLFTFICFSSFNISVAFFLFFFSINKLSLNGGVINLVSLFFSFLGCMVCMSSSNLLIVCVGFFVSSMFGVFCLIKSMKSNSFSLYLLLFFNLLCDSFMILFLFFYISSENGLFHSDNCSIVGGFTDYFDSNSFLFLLFFLGFSYKSAWFLLGFWVYFAMDAGYFVSCFLHSSGVIFLGLCFWSKVVCFISAFFVNYVVMFCLLGCVVNFVFFLFSDKFKKSLGILSCMSYNIFFVCFLVNVKLFFIYFFLHSFVKGFSFMVVFVFKKMKFVWVNYFIFFILFLFFFSYFSFICCFDFFYYDSSWVGFVFNTMVFLEFMSYIKFFSDLLYVYGYCRFYFFLTLFKVFKSKQYKGFVFSTLFMCLCFIFFDLGVGLYQSSCFFLLIFLLTSFIINKSCHSFLMFIFFFLSKFLLKVFSVNVVIEFYFLLFFVLDKVLSWLQCFVLKVNTNFFIVFLVVCLLLIIV